MNIINRVLQRTRANQRVPTTQMPLSAPPNKGAFLSMTLGNMLSKIRDSSSDELTQQIYREYASTLERNGFSLLEVRTELLSQYADTPHAGVHVEALIKKLYPSPNPIHFADSPSIHPPQVQPLRSPPSEAPQVRTSNPAPAPVPQQQPQQTAQMVQKTVVKEGTQRNNGIHLISDTSATYRLRSGYERYIELRQDSFLNEIAAHKPFSVVVIGDPGSGVSTMLRVLLSGAIANQKGVGMRPDLDLVDLRNSSNDVGWQNLQNYGNSVETIDLSRPTIDGSDEGMPSTQVLAEKIEEIANDVRARHDLLRSGHQPKKARIFIIDGWCAYFDFNRSATDKRTKESDTSAAIISNLLFILRDGPRAGVTTIIGARNHEHILSPAMTEALCLTSLIVLGRNLGKERGGYRAIARIVEDKEMIPLSFERDSCKDFCLRLIQANEPVALTLNGGCNFYRLPNFSESTKQDLSQEYGRLPSFPQQV